jgi:predicted DNA-binding protein (MmcQ/YjbR family)
MMNVEEIRDYVLSLGPVTESFPFDEHTLVFKIGGKMFLLVALEKSPVHLALKNLPDKNQELREQYPHQIFGAYHMNKTHWNSVVLNHQLPAPLVKKLIYESFILIVQSLSRKVQSELKLK